MEPWFAIMLTLLVGGALAIAVLLVVGVLADAWWALATATTLGAIWATALVGALLWAAWSSVSW